MMHDRTIFRRAAAAVLLAAPLAGCGVTELDHDPVVLASVYNTSGFQAVLDGPTSEGSRLAVTEINAAGGVLREELELVEVNVSSDAAALANATDQRLAADPRILALFGLSDTDMVLAVAPVADDHDLLFLTSGATSPKLPQQAPGDLYLAAFGDNVQAAAGAEWAYEDLDARDALILYDADETYTDLLKGYFSTRFSALGGTITDAVAIDPRTEPITLPAIGDVDLVYLAVQTAEDAVRVIPLLREAGYTGPVLGGDGYDAQSVWAGAPDIADVYFTTHVYLGDDSTNPRVKTFLTTWEAAHPGVAPSAFAALGYDAVRLLVAAIERSKAATVAGVKSGLAGLQNFDGVTGSISFAGTSRIPTKSVTILRVADGAQVFVTETTPQQVPNP
jgi:branched-chain amino acid transport system substrate-binding protein